MAERLLAFYHPPEVGDPEVFISGVVELFQSYPTEVVADACAVRGLPTKYKWFPALSEIKQELDLLYAPIIETQRWQKRLQDMENRERRQLEERDQRLLELAVNGPSEGSFRATKKTYEELVELCAKDGLLIGPKQQMPVEKIELIAKAIREKYHVPLELWNDIPNAPPRT
jgi:hypothetical protein